MIMSWNDDNSAFNARPKHRGILRSALKKTVHMPQRKRLVEERKDEEELLIFGYACKLFPPDEHSRMIGRLQHLIPWNGDEELQLMIDRYDARASLHSLSEFDGDSWNKHYETSEEEARIEQLCDQERYMAMYTDIAEEKIRHEEELKRLHASIASNEETSSFNEVGFNYGAEPAPPSDDQKYYPFDATKETDNSPGPKEPDYEEKPFMAPASLGVPPEMEIPPTEKMHAIIEKTANFVSGHGAQMEIVLKAKQANNSQFLFLQFEHYLNPYYKHMVKRIKEGKYRPGMKEEKEEGSDKTIFENTNKVNKGGKSNSNSTPRKDSDSSSDGEGGYLHPSLFASSNSKKKEEENKEKFKAIQTVDPNHPLAKLIEKGKRANAMKQFNLLKSTAQNSKAGKNATEGTSLSPFGNVDGGSGDLSHDKSATAIVPPPPDLQPMVDSVARQVAEDGDSVEDRLRAQDDPMMAFLLPSHELHPYYLFRKTFIRNQIRAQEQLKNEKDAADLNKNEGEKTSESASDEIPADKATPISFSIKSNKESTQKQGLMPLPNRLQLLGNESGEEEEVEDKKETKEIDEVKEKSVAEGNKEQPAVSSVDVRQSVRISGFSSAANFQKKEVGIDLPRPKVIQPVIHPSNFTVVTPTGVAASIADMREKQAERRQKVTLFLKMKNQNPQTEIPTPLSRSTVASEDIFDIEDDDMPESMAVSCKETNESEKPNSEGTPPINSEDSSDRKSSSAVSTLKDLVDAASSRSSTPLSVDVKRDRQRSQSRQSSPCRKKRSRSRSRGAETLPSSYRKRRGTSREKYSSYRTSSSRHENDESVPSAYKIENPEPSSRSNGNYHRSKYRRKSQSPSPPRSHKRHHRDADRDEGRKKRRSHRSSSSRSKKKSKKKHKKIEKKAKTKKKKEKQSSSEEGEWTSSDSDSNCNEDKTEIIRSNE